MSDILAGDVPKFSKVDIVYGQKRRPGEKHTATKVGMFCLKVSPQAVHVYARHAGLLACVCTRPSR